jgi:hypothetical protein
VRNIYFILIVMAIVPATIVAQNQIPIFPSKAMTPSGQTRTMRFKNDSVLIQEQNINFISHLKDIDISFDSITAVTFGGDERIWIGSKNGLWVFDSGQFREYSYKDGLFDKNINHLYYSSEGQIWAATSTGPFVLLDNHFYVFEPLKNQNILNISENSNNWFFLTENGISVIGKEKRFFETLYVQILAILLIVIVITAFMIWGIAHLKTRIEWKTELIKVEQDALLAQMSPHFIFNSLNSVQRYILANDKECANIYLQKFASMMRKVLENSSLTTITLSEEIATLDLYLQLESLRFDNGFDYNISVQDKDIGQFEIPTMLLHTFVENAVWHGLMNKESRGKIDLRFSKINKKFILCEIEDNGIGRKKAAEYKSKHQGKHKSKGTEIVKKRIELLNLKVRQKITYETIDLGENDSKYTGTLVRLEIPVTLM